MADSSVAITAGSGTNIDTRTEASNGQHRQVVVLGDPSINAGVAPVDATKGLAVDLTNTGANSTAIKVDNSAVTQPVSISTNQPVGTVAHDGADSGNPIKVGGRARSSEIASVSSDDRTDFVADLVGKQIVLPYANPENFVSGCITSAMTGTTSTSLIAAPASGLRNYITQITVSNSSTTVPTDIIIQDGSGGTTLYVLPCPAGTGTGTGASGGTFTFPTPLRQPTTATAIFCANVTTSSSTKVSATGYKGY